MEDSTCAGSLDARLVFVNSYPCANQPLSEKAEMLLASIIEKSGISEQDLFIINACPYKNKDSMFPDIGAIEAWKEYVAQTLMRMPNIKVIIGLGDIAKRSLLDDKSTATKNIGLVHWCEELNSHVLLTHHPEDVIATEEKFDDFCIAFQQAKQLLDLPKQEYKKEEIKFIVPINIGDAIQKFGMLSALIKSNTIKNIVCDIETEGLNYLTDKIITIGISWEDDFALIIPAKMFSDLSSVLQEIFESTYVKWCWHNGKFDIKFLRHQLKINARVDNDTMLQHYSLNAHKKGHKLEKLCAEYLMVPSYKIDFGKLKKADQNLNAVSIDEIARHQSKDCCYTLQLFKLFSQELGREENSKLKNVYESLLIPCSEALAKIEMRGMLIDYDKLCELQKEFNDRKDATENTCRQIISEKSLLLGEAENFNPRSPQSVARTLYGTFGLEPTLGHSSSQKALKHYKDQALVSSILEYREIHKLARTYIEGILERLDTDSKLHTNYTLHVTETGRLSSRDPNLQNIPTGSSIKEVFLPSKTSNVLIHADYKQLEIRVAAWYSRDKNLIHACKGDIHGEVCRAVFSQQMHIIDEAERLDEVGAILYLIKTDPLLSKAKLQLSQHPETESDISALAKMCRHWFRFACKHITFGVIYGRGPKSLAEEELNCPVNAASDYIKKFFKRFPDLKKQLDTWSDNALSNGYVETHDGRRRNFSFITDNNKYQVIRQAKNMPIQAMASDICLKALLKLENEYNIKFGGNVLMTVHDSIDFDCPYENVVSAGKYIKETMESVIIDSDVKFEVDLEYGETWGTQKPLVLQE